MSQLLSSYIALSSSSPRHQVSESLAKIINASPLSLDDDQRSTLIQTVIDDVHRLIKKDDNHDTGRLRSEDAAQALLVIKTLGRAPAGSKVIAKQSNLSDLLEIAQTLENNADASNEAFRCIANCLLLVAEARITFVEGVGGGRAMVILLERSNNPERIFLASRILFLASVSITSATGFIKSLIEARFPDQNATMVDIIGSKLETLTSSILGSEKMAKEAMTDLLKFTFNLLLHYPKIVDNTENDSTPGNESEPSRKVMGDCWSDKLDGLLSPLLRLLNNLPPTFPAPLAAPLMHVLHALITIPVTTSLRLVWFPVATKAQSSPSSKTPSPAGSPRTSGNEIALANPKNSSSGNPKEVKMGALDRALSKLTVSRRSPSPGVALDTLLRCHDLLDVTLSHYMPGDVDPDDPSVRNLCRDETDSTLDDVVCPLVLLLTKLCGEDESSRKRMRTWILPDDLDRTSPLEGRPDLLGRCLRLLSCVHHARLKDATGEMLFAICDSDASTLASYVGYGNVAGFLFNKGFMSAPPSTATTSAPTTPSGAQIDPITGVIKEEAPPIEMTDEEKEQEAEKLFVLFDRLERSGALPPNQNPIRRAAREGRLG